MERLKSVRKIDDNLQVVVQMHTKKLLGIHIHSKQKRWFWPGYKWKCESLSLYQVVETENELTTEKPKLHLSLGHSKLVVTETVLAWDLDLETKIKGMLNDYFTEKRLEATIEKQIKSIE